MYINHLGHSCFKLESKDNPATLITDPFDKEIGLNVPKMVADVVTVSHSHHDHCNVKNIKDSEGKKPFIINLSGEYEIKNIFIYGIPSYHDSSEGKERGENIIYRIEIDGISVVHLGDLGHLLANNTLEKLEGTDILLVPVGGKYTIDAKQASQAISQIEPRIVIPMHYKTEGLKIDIEPLDGFFKEMGVSNPERVDKLKLSKKDLPQGTMQIVVMN